MTEQWTESELRRLVWMARQFKTDTGREPKTIKEIGDHWDDLSGHTVIHEHIDENGIQHPAQTLLEMDGRYTPHCIWLREVQERPDARAMLAVALCAPEAL